MAQSLDFYDLRLREKFSSSNYEVYINAKGMLVAKAIGPSGNVSIRIIGRA